MSATTMHYYPVRRSMAALWSQRLASFSAVLLLTAATGHRLAMLETPGFLLVLGLTAAIAAASLALAAFGFSRVWNRGDLGGRNIAAAVVLAVLVLAPFGIALYLGLTLPQLTDVSTDVDDPPELTRPERSVPGVNAVTPFTAEEKKLQLEHYPMVTGRRYAMTFDRVLETAIGLVRERGWELIPPAPDGDAVETTIRAAARTWLLGFPADVSIRLTDEETSTYVDMRSASRFGSHDLGGNAGRVAAFLADLDAAIAILAGMPPAEPLEGGPADGGFDQIPTPAPRPPN